MMGKVKTVQDYQDTIEKMHNKLYSPGAKNDVERTTMERQLKRQLGAWADKVMVIVKTPGNEQNPWTFEELDLAVELMELKKDTGERQVGDYQVKVCTHESTGDKDPAIWKYIPIVIERKGGPQSKKYNLMFNWSEVALGEYSSLVEFLHKEHECEWVQYDHVIIFNSGTSFTVADGPYVIRLDLDKNRKNVLMSISNDDVSTVFDFTYKVRKTPKTAVLKVYEVEYGTGKGGPHDLYGSLYGKTELKNGSIRYNRDRLHEEIYRFKEDDRFKDGQFWLIAECTEADFLQYKPVFNGSKRNKGFGANVVSRRESIWSLAVHMGSPIHWAGTRHAAIKDFNSIIRQGLIRHYAYLLGL
jgi:hypothetical protein